jgi:general secretion pathway protein G
MLFLNRKTLNKIKTNVSLMKLNSKGMTLVEIMIVLAIIGGLMALLAPRFTGALDKSKVRETKIAMGQIQNALNMYYTDCGKFPKTLDALVKAPSSDECSNWGPDAYLKKEAKDAWGTPFIYELDGNQFIIKSLGNDRREGGAEYAKDITSEEL